jgi:hypothetical protein
MVLSVKIVILQCMLALLIGFNSAKAAPNTQILLDDKLSVVGLVFSIDTDLDSDTDLSFFEQTQLETCKQLSTNVSVFSPPQKPLIAFTSHHLFARRLISTRNI